jgi:hypothetical protein
MDQLVFCNHCLPHVASLTRIATSLYQIAGWIGGWDELGCRQRTAIGRPPDLTGQACSSCSSRWVMQMRDNRQLSFCTLRN